jgi:cell division protein FtsX
MIRQLPETDPLIAQRILAYQQSSRSYTLDQSLEQQQALKNLNQVVTREAQVRAYSDVIRLNGIVALLLLLWGVILIARNQYQLRQQNKTLNA